MNAPLDVPTKQDHRTPEYVLDVIRAYAPIGLDPCGNPWSTVGARVELSAHRGEDGLEADWHAIVEPGEIAFVNCPYGQGQIVKWAVKCGIEAVIGVESLLLVPVSPETLWARQARELCSAFGPWAKRIPFVGAGGSGAKQPSALYHFGPNRFLFAHHFEPHLSYVEVFR